MDSFMKRLDKFMSNLIGTRTGMHRVGEAGGEGYGAAKRFIAFTDPVVAELVKEHYEHSGIGNIVNKAVRCEITYEELKELSAESAKNRERLDKVNLKRAV